MILSCNYNTGKFGFLVRNTRFGKTQFVFNPDSTNYDEFFSSKILTDFSISYFFKKGMRVSLGANDVFDVYPDRIKNYVNTADGRNIYAMEGQPFGFNGGYYFMGLNFIF
jgi:iron complex outermembrane receptor protein